MGDFDFDYWKLLAERDPVAYFAARDMTLRQFIASHPGQAVMLTELQARIDSTRVLAGGPTQACRELLGQMQDQLMLLSFKLAELQRETSAVQEIIGAKAIAR
ncbi:DUF3135 domain-containing protein [Zoogloea sp.]|mgnify:FL=1|jgi:hypothetical protein|uniref:DUF3135 domain-containing protein n=1 Tax=Zoogloea sp. TaxID=49181 RepID=UPI001B562ACC|nr:DUF3135 domain-containing protein [Zoogloea sp.]MBK6656220.1 DUF3135 domain-containing protein [Zoogloea sp.]MBK7848870.1 DUF3135 domain-containing protein [Zoogloea sp.]MBP7443478.1 DUF3135 domain-containing protein [Zoogloea sp.]HOY00454.1 DUF3135 domain-containing protein [Zoogloea sp.]HPI60800.1 DUF3135 domain-containing protein [Zoogloea sp.]